MTQETAEVRQQVDAFQRDFHRLVTEIQKEIVGYDEQIRLVATALFARGHILLEGVPGLGKTQLVKSLAQAIHTKFSRIQFTPDLMPADIVGTTMVMEDEAGKKTFRFQRGPVFANVLLADEINRATPKTQSALLEAMQEHTVTSGDTTYRLDEPFFVLGTQNPLEMEGTYPLPEAQLDRFFMKLKVEFPTREHLHTILDRTTAAENPHAKKIVTRERILEMKELVRRVPVARPVQDFAVRVLEATHPTSASATPASKKYVRFGSSPRGAQSILLGAKISALMSGRFAVACDDIRKVATACLRHRIILNFEGEAEGVSTDQIVAEILKATPEAK